MVITERRRDLARRKAIDELLLHFAAAMEINLTDYEREMICGTTDSNDVAVEPEQFLELCRRVARFRTIGLESGA